MHLNQGRGCQHSTSKSLGFVILGCLSQPKVKYYLNFLNLTNQLLSEYQ